MLRLIPFVVLVIVATACSSGDGASGEAPSTTAVASTTDSTVTTAAETTTTSEEPAAAVVVTTSVPDDWRYGQYDHRYAYQSVGYSCGGDPTTGCGGDTDMSLIQIWIHKDDKDSGGESGAADCLDLLMKPQIGADSDFMDLLDDIDSATTHADSRWGIRMVQLDSPPDELDIGGKAWLELTVSSVSAAEFSALGPRAPRTTGVQKFFSPTSNDPVSVETNDGTTNFIEELVLVETTDDMMQWIIVLNQDETFRYRGGYWGASGQGWTNGLSIKIGH